MSNYTDPELSETDENLDSAEPQNSASQLLPRPPSQEEVNLEDAFSKLFKSSVSGTGEEELLRIASDYALQINAHQIKLLLYLEFRAEQYRALAKAMPKKERWYFWQADFLSKFVYRWLDLKRHNNSDVFVMRGLDTIS